MIYRVERRDNPFVQVDKGFINDKRLGYREKGILLYFLSKPEGWNFYVEEIASNSSDGVSSVKAGIRKLIETGYIVRGKRIRNEKGQLGAYEYIVKEVPATCDSPTQVSPTQVCPTEAKCTLLNNNSTNNNSSNNDLTNNDKSSKAQQPKNEKSERKNSKQQDKFFGHSFSDELKQAITEWLTYKSERRESYKPTGLKMLLTEIEHKTSTYEEQDIIDVIYQSMASNWKGICWDKLKGKEKHVKPQDKPIPQDILEAKQRHDEAMKKFMSGKCDWKDLIPE